MNNTFAKCISSWTAFTEGDRVGKLVACRTPRLGCRALAAELSGTELSVNPTDAKVDGYATKCQEETE